MFSLKIAGDITKIATALPTAIDTSKLSTTDAQLANMLSTGVGQRISGMTGNYTLEIIGDTSTGIRFSVNITPITIAS